MTNIPEHIFKAAAEVHKWFADQGFAEWQCGKVVAREMHYKRVTELLDANSKLVERARAAEHRADVLATLQIKNGQEVYRLSKRVEELESKLDHKPLGVDK